MPVAPAQRRITSSPDAIVADGRLTTAIQWAMGEGLMRRLLFPLLTFVVLAFAPSAAIGRGPFDFATGSGTESFGVRTFDFSFSAHDGPHGAHGRVVMKGLAMPPQYTGGDIRIQGPVECLAVAGNRANVIFTVAKSNSSDLPVGMRIGWSVFDGPNGDFSGWFPPAQFHIDAICSGGIAAGAGGQVSEGDVVVRDVD
jgi:hypothetical protein